ncbi:carboxylesterase family protein [Colletotrichum plurivorum]|uniref:Carboxylesterase family protein n=1 Tax=Colletotrichum plurivorum TaxID=2175906 RepID=A0A8H6NA85_9PEZI|nr:carboxylesterase family protein [Colletotrichum plurivorum]
MPRRPRSRAHSHAVDVSVFEDDTATAPNLQCFGIDVNTTSDSVPFPVLQDFNPNIGAKSPDFVESLTARLKNLNIYSPQKNRGCVDRSLPLPAGSLPHLPQLSSGLDISVLGSVREEAKSCDNNASATTCTQGPFPAESPLATSQGEGLPSLAETHASTAATACQAPDSFEPSFPSRACSVLRAANLENQTLSVDSRIKLSIERHQAGQYDFVLSVRGPESSAARNELPPYLGKSTLNFGCNVLVQRGKTVCCQGKPANAYTILATPLGDEDVNQGASELQLEGATMAVPEPAVRVASPTPTAEVLLSKASQSSVTTKVVEGTQQDSSPTVVEHPQDRVVSVSSEDSGQMPQMPHTPSRSTSASSQSRIEDSVEALDRLEEELEAVDAAISPSKSRQTRAVTHESTAAGDAAVRRSGSIMRRAQSASVGNKSSSSEKRGVPRKSVVAAKEDGGSPAKTPARKPTVSRPTSLLPPKPPVRSSKPPTKPSFELPGEAVARRIKEQREARLAQQAQEKSAAAAIPQRTRSTKAPTRPNFELPGEAISRRKREEREARLKAQEEEERRRREFKARPIKANLASASYPRETATSRARQNKGLDTSEVGKATENPYRRSSVLGAPRASLARPTSTKSPQTRGRGTSQASASTQVSRATSTSTSSMSGKRSTLSAEDLEQQKMRGKEVFERDNCYLEDKERERRERELNAKLAREEAAERSRQASREWAEKQRRKQLAARQAA